MLFPALASQPGPCQCPAMLRPNFYVHPSLDRAGRYRRDTEWIARITISEHTRILPVWQGRNLIAGPPEAPHVAMVPATEAWWRGAAAETVMLGIDGDVTYLAVDVSGIADPAADPVLAGFGSFLDLRAVGPLLPHEEGALLAYARGMVWWHSRHRFCGVCGHPTVSSDAGHRRDCTNPECRTQHFPSTDPAVIMLIHDGDRVLLGRQKAWPPGMHSVLAGFLEPGESLEDAVKREVLEEAGVRVDDVRYHSSQPWPFPQSLMVGFTGRALSADIQVDQDELETAAWFERDWLRRHVDDESFRLPRRDSIARRLLEDWLADE